MKRMRNKKGEEEYYSYIKNLFDRWAPVYNIMDIFISKIRHKVVDFVQPMQGAKILDVATGTGKQAMAFGEKGYDVIGIDLSESMLQRAKKENRYPNVRFEIADATKIPFDDTSFDVTCISFALHDMPPSVRKKVLQEMVRVTKLTGVLVVIDYTLPEDKIKKMMMYHFIKLNESKYYPHFAKSDLSALLRESGIRIEKEGYQIGGAVKIIQGLKMP